VSGDTVVLDLKELSFCPNCECSDCEDAREWNELLEEFHQKCESWNWNAHPMEIAKEIQEMDLADDVLDLLFRKIEDFFDASARVEVEEIYHLL
jgi:hypothetical protein